MGRFITNHPTKDLAARLADLIEASKELKFLVGFFYFSGWRELYEPLKHAAQEDGFKLKVLVGMSVDRRAGGLLEVARKAEGSNNAIASAFAEEFTLALSDPSLDLPDFPEQARFFLKLLEEGRLEIRKTRDPNHAKLYLFKVDGPQQKLLGSQGKFITGSSNFTHAGLRGQHEFNVEISDYGFEDAEKYFDELWRRAVPLRPEDIARVREIIERGSLAAQPTPFEVYALLIKRYLELLDKTDGHPNPEGIIKHAGYEPFPYQIDAAKAALAILEVYNGVILADVVGLGKSVVASLVGRILNKRGIVIAPPGLIGERGAAATYGWRKYLDDFGLFDWEVFSIGKLEDALTYAQNPRNGIEVVVVDEAHRFRNPDTEAYAMLRALTANKQVILLTATPYNNTPTDIYALLSLFDAPGASKLAPGTDLQAYFKRLTQRFRDFGHILRFFASNDPRRRKKARALFERYFEGHPEDLELAKHLAREGLAEVAREVKRFIAPVTVRRNRLDLKLDPRYRDTAPPFPRVRPPEPVLYELSEEQSAFYDRVIRDWFGPEGAYRGAAYQPELYKEGRVAADDLGEDENPALVFAVESQRNLANFMRRLLVRRFESSFGAFAQTLSRIQEAHRKSLRLAEETNHFILDRKLLDMLDGGGLLDPEEYLEQIANEDEEAIRRGERTRSRNYDLGSWQPEDRVRFLEDLRRDLALLEAVQREVEQLGLADPNNDPKARQLAAFLKERLGQDAGRKLIIFSEFTDTVEHVAKSLEAAGIRALTVSHSINDTLMRRVLANFDASQPKEGWRDDYDVLLTSDKLSEGVNLGRAGAVINYDIPWNPTRVIQRVGRVNRIGTKLFDELYIYHFFPTEQGREVTDPKAVAAQKLFLIHRALGEDAKILDPDEEPRPARVYEKLTADPEEADEVSFEVKIRQEWEALLKAHPEIERRIEALPNRVKVARPGKSKVLIFLRKARGFFAAEVDPAGPSENREGIRYLSFPEALPLTEAEPETPRLEPSETFWETYSEVLNRLTRVRPEPLPSNSLERLALQNLQTLLRQYTDTLTEEEVRVARQAFDDLQYGARRLPRYVLRKLQALDLGAAQPNEEALHRLRELLAEISRTYGALIDAPPEAELPEVVVGIEFRPPEPG